MEREKLTVLVIDDDPVDAELLARYLEEIPGRDIVLVARDNSEAALEALADGADVDVVFVDYLLGAQTGLDVLRLLKSSGVHQPIIMLTGQGNEMVAVEAMKAGAADYLIKGHLSSDDLHRALLNAMEKAALHRKIEEQRRELERLAKTDGLTGVFNRRFFMERLGEALARRGPENPVSLLMIDLDHFKKVNDTHGHIAGDAVLVRAAGLIRTAADEDAALRPDHPAVVARFGGEAVAGRFGGEEFCLLLEGASLEEAGRLAEELRASVERQSFTSPAGAEFSVTCSIGVAEAEAGGGLEGLIHNADDALYRAKSDGRNRVRIAPTQTPA